MKSRRTSCAYAHSSMARLTNSPPSSTVIACGARCRCTWLSAAAGRSDLQIIGVFPVIDTEDDLAFHRRIALVRSGLDDERAAVIDHHAQATDAGSRELFLEGVKTANDDVSVRACWLRVTTGNGIVWWSAPRR
jgi:hypothetical protein